MSEYLELLQRLLEDRARAFTTKLHKSLIYWSSHHIMQPHVECSQLSDCDRCQFSNSLLSLRSLTYCRTFDISNTHTHTYRNRLSSYRIAVNCHLIFSFNFLDHSSYTDGKIQQKFGRGVKRSNAIKQTNRRLGCLDFDQVQ